VGGANTQFVTSLVLSLIFVFFARRPDETAGPIATLNGSYDAVSAKEVQIRTSNLASMLPGKVQS